MPRGKKKGGLGGKRKKAIIGASFTRWAKRQAAARRKQMGGAIIGAVAALTIGSGLTCFLTSPNPPSAALTTS